MTIATFYPPRAPAPGINRKPESKLLEAQFGDGYTQATADGINHIRDIASLKWDGLTQSEADAMLAFWKQQGGGATAFLYTLPGATSPTKWTWKDYGQTFDFTRDTDDVIYSITATFRQSFNVTT